MDALRELVAGPSYTPKKATTRLKQLEWDGGIAERAKILYVVPAPALPPPFRSEATESCALVLQGDWNGAQAFSLRLQYISG